MNYRGVWSLPAGVRISCGWQQPIWTAIKMAVQSTARLEKRFWFPFVGLKPACIHHTKTRTCNSAVLSTRGINGPRSAGYSGTVALEYFFRLLGHHSKDLATHHFVQSTWERHSEKLFRIFLVFFRVLQKD